MNRKRRKTNKWIFMFLIMLFGMSLNVSAKEIVVNNDEQLELTEGENLREKWGEPDQYVEGLYNVGKNARADLTGMIQLSQYKTKVQADYSTSYSYDVSKIGIKNLKLQYKGSLGIWYTIVTFDDRHVTNDSLYMGSFTCNGTIGRTYRLQGTHYAVVNGTTKTRFNTTEGLTFR